MILNKSLSQGAVATPTVAFNTGIAKCKRRGGIVSLIGWTVKTGKKSQSADCESLGTVIEVKEQLMLL